MSNKHRASKSIGKQPRDTSKRPPAHEVTQFAQWLFQWYLREKRWQQSKLREEVNKILATEEQIDETFISKVIRGHKKYVPPAFVRAISKLSGDKTEAELLSMTRRIAVPAALSTKQPDSPGAELTAEPTRLRVGCGHFLLAAPIILANRFCRELGEKTGLSGVVTQLASYGPTLESPWDWTGDPGNMSGQSLIDDYPVPSPKNSNQRAYAAPDVIQRLFSRTTPGQPPSGPLFDIVAAPSPVIQDQRQLQPTLLEVGSLISSSTSGCELILDASQFSEGEIHKLFGSERAYKEYIEGGRTRQRQIDSRELGNWLVRVLENASRTRKDLVIAADKDTIAHKTLQFALADAAPAKDLYTPCAWVDGIENADIGQKDFKQLQELNAVAYSKGKVKRPGIVCGAMTWQPHSCWLMRSHPDNIAVSIRLAPDLQNREHPRHFVYKLVVDERRFDDHDSPLRRADVAAFVRIVEAATTWYLDDLHADTIGSPLKSEKHKAIEFLRGYFGYEDFDTILDALLKYDFDITTTPSFTTAICGVTLP